MSPASYRAAPPRGGDTTVANGVHRLQIASGRVSRPVRRRGRGGRLRAGRRRLLGSGRTAAARLVLVHQSFQLRLGLADLHRVTGAVGVLELLDRLIDLRQGHRSAAVARGRRGARRAVVVVAVPGPVALPGPGTRAVARTGAEPDVSPVQWPGRKSLRASPTVLPYPILLPYTRITRCRLGYEPPVLALWCTTAPRRGRTPRAGASAGFRAPPGRRCRWCRRASLAARCYRL